MSVSDGDVLRIVCKMSWGDSDIQNTYHCKVDGSGFGTNEEVLEKITEHLDACYDDIDPDIPNEVTFDTVEGYNLTADEYLGEVEWTSLTAGAGVSNPGPPQIAPLVLFNTSVPASQGRKFLPPVTSPSFDTDGTPSSDLLSRLSLYAGRVLIGVIASTWEAEFGNYRSTTATFLPWLSSQVRDIFATQRRRYFGSGS